MTFNLKSVYLEIRFNWRYKHLHVKADFMVEYKLCELSNTISQESKPCRNCDEKSFDKKQRMDDTKAKGAIAFKDIENDYRVYSKRFLNAAIVRGYREISTGKKIKITKHTKIFTDTDKEKMRLRKANNRVYCDLVLVCQGDRGFDLVDEPVAANSPESDAILT